MYDVKALEKAFLIIDAVEGELVLGTKHYRTSDGHPLYAPLDIIMALKENDLTIEPTPERKRLFGGKG